jgi:hypothetical protein
MRDDLIAMKHALIAEGVAVALILAMGFIWMRLI